MSGPSEFSCRRDRIIALTAGVSVALLGVPILAGWLLRNEALKISAVLTDIMLPYMNGVALIRALRKMKPDLVFIASSGQGEQTRLSELQSLKVSNFLSKPYDTQKLLMTLKTAMGTQPAL